MVTKADNARRKRISHRTKKRGEGEPKATRLTSDLDEAAEGDWSGPPLTRGVWGAAAAAGAGGTGAPGLQRGRGRVIGASGSEEGRGRGENGNKQGEGKLFYFKDRVNTYCVTHAGREETEGASCFLLQEEIYTYVRFLNSRRAESDFYGNIQGAMWYTLCAKANVPRPTGLLKCIGRARVPVGSSWKLSRLWVPRLRWHPKPNMITTFPLPAHFATPSSPGIPFVAHSVLLSLDSLV